MKLTRDAVLWFAGLFEGEGFFRFCPKGRRSMGLAIKMTDRDVLEKAQAYFGGWMWDGQKKAEPHHKQPHLWRLDHRDRAYALLVAIYQFLGERRKQQVEKWIAQYRKLTPIERKTVTHGTVNSYRHYGCRCPACTEANTAYYRIKRIEWRAKAASLTT